MCQNAQKSAISLMSAIEPTLTELFTQTGIAGTTVAQTVVSEYDAALTAVENWTSGTAAQDAIQVINAFESGVSTLTTAIPSLASVGDLVNIILAGIATVIAVLTANSPADTTDDNSTVETAADPEVATAHYQAEVAIQAEAKVKTLAPKFKRSIFHSITWNYEKAWNDQVAAGDHPASLKVTLI